MMKSKLIAILRMCVFHIVFVALIALLLKRGMGDNAARSFLIGGLFFAVNFVLLGLTWSFIFSKKYIALALGVSVIKFSILGIILYELIVRGGIQPVLFSLGCAAFVLTAFVEAAYAHFGSRAGM